MGYPKDKRGGDIEKNDKSSVLIFSAQSEGFTWTSGPIKSCKIEIFEVMLDFYRFLKEVLGWILKGD